MDAYINQLSGYLLAQSWQIAILTFVIAFVTFLLKNKSAHVRYLLWLIVLTKCLVPPLFAVPVAVLPEQVHNKPSIVPVLSEVNLNPTVSNVSIEPVIIEAKVSVNRIETRKLNTTELFILVWLSGVILFLI